MSKSISPKDAKPVDELLQRDELSVVDAASVLKVSRETVYKMIERGELTVSSRKTANRGTNVSTQSVKAFIKNIQKRPIPTRSGKAVLRG